MSLVEQALATLAAKGAEARLLPDLAAAAAAIRAAVPPGERLAVHASAPAELAAMLQDLDLNLLYPADLAGEAARTAIFGAGFGLTGATAIAARTGSVLLAEADGFGRAISNMAPTHIVVARVSDLVADVYAGTERAAAWARSTMGRPVPPFLTIISGSSRTGDIEFELVKGAHGPIRVLVLLVE